MKKNKKATKGHSKRTKKIQRRKNRISARQQQTSAKKEELKKLDKKETAFLYSQDKLYDSLNYFAEQIEEEVTKRVLIDTIGDEFAANTRDFIKENEEIIDLERDVYRGIEGMIFSLFYKDYDLDKNYDLFKNGKKNLEKKMKSLLEKKIFLKLDDYDSIVETINDVVKKILENNTIRLNSLKRKTAEAKGKYMDMQRAYNEQKEVKRKRIEKENAGECNRYEEEIKDEIKKLTESQFSDNIKSVYKNQNWYEYMLNTYITDDKLLQEIAGVISIDVDEMITNHFAKKISVFQRTADYFVSGICENMENIAEIIKNVDSEAVKKTIYYFFQILRKENVADSLMIDAPPENDLGIYYKKRQMLPSFKGLRKLQDIIRAVSKSKYQTHLRKILDNFNERETEKQTNILEDLAEILNKEGEHNLDNLMQYIAKKSKNIPYTRKLLETIALSPDTINAFDSEELRKQKNSVILRFLEKAEWTYTDDDEKITLADALTKLGLEKDEINYIIENPEMFQFHDRSAFMLRIFQDEALKKCLKKNEMSSYHKTILIQFGPEFLKITSRSKEEAGYILQEIASKKELREYFDRMDAEWFTKKHEIKDLMGENLEQILDDYSEIKENMYETLIELKDTEYFDVILHDKEIFEKICKRMSREPCFNRILKNLRYRKTKDSHSYIKSLVKEVKIEERAKVRKVIIVSGLMDQSVQKRLTETFDLDFEFFQPTKRANKYNGLTNEDLVIYDISHSGHSGSIIAHNMCDKRGARYEQVNSPNYEKLFDKIKKYAFTREIKET